MTTNDNDILCVPAAAVRGMFASPAIAANPGIVSEALGRLSGTETFRPRSPELETDESLKQLATYVVLRHKAPSHRARMSRGPLGPLVDHVWVYRRAAGSGEGRLHERWSAGIGGHVERLDAHHLSASLSDAIHFAAGRELGEELDYFQFDVMRGFFINDDSDPVGRVHLGYGMVVDVPDPSVVKVRETVALDADPAAGLGWLPLARLADCHGAPWSKLESWSKLVVAALAEGRLG